MKRIILITLLAALVLAGAASAAQINVTITSTDKWVTADNKDEATITITVIDTAGEHAGEPFEGANVSLSVNSPWQLKGTHLLTDKKGVASTTFLPTKVSGTANITITVGALKLTELFGWVTYEETQVYSQICDHGTPYAISPIYKSQVQVRTPTPISVYVKDYYGNPVDNRGEVVEKVRFDASSKGLAGFLSGSTWVKSLSVPVNESGFANVEFMADPVGTNYVLINPPSPINSRLLSIEGLATGKPFKITSVVSPDGKPFPYTIVKTGYFTLGYTLTDQYGYPTMNQPVNITTSSGEIMSFSTNKNGMVVINYGPKDIAGIYTITATAANNLSVTDTMKLEFVSGAPADALLTASPQTMASRDVKDDITSDLTMRVMDQKGNPVAGEVVRFRFKSLDVDKKFNQTTLPILESGGVSTSFTGVDITAVTDDNGNAVVKFHPGAFTTAQNVKDYSAQAKGTAVVEAQWSSVIRQVTLGYVNFPYLTIESWVSPATLRVNETVDVTVKVRGDGWALQPKPIDVLLLSDRSGSMLSDYPDRAVSVMGADKVFTSQLDYTRDRLGLVSFGGKGKPDVTGNEDCGMDGDSSDDASYTVKNYPGNGRTYADNATLDLVLSANPNTITTEISRIVPGGYTSMRYALKIGIDQIVANPRTGAVRAIVLLSDGDYNYYGDPLARGSAGPKDPSSYGDLDSRHLKFSSITNNTQQNMAEYAKANKIRIFTIGFAQGISSGGQSTLQLLATNTGGKYFFAPTGNQLNAIYTEIAGSLQDTAGANTVMNLSFQNIMVNNVSVPGDQVYSYEYIPMHSTFVNTWNTTVNPLPGYPKSIDSSGEWAKDHTINFLVGTIRLNQTWQSTVSFRVLKDGNINVFDQSSKITVQDSPYPLKIPDVFITALPNSSAVALGTAAHLQVTGLTLTNKGSKTSADLRWNLAYDGKALIAEDVMISPFGTEDWYHLPVKAVSNTTAIDTASMPITGLEDGYYTIRVDVDAADANEDSDVLYIIMSSSDGVSVVPGGVPPFPTPGTGSTAKKTYIKIS
jgi:hypothetical protein